MTKGFLSNYIKNILRTFFKISDKLIKPWIHKIIQLGTKPIADSEMSKEAIARSQLPAAG